MAPLSSRPVVTYRGSDLYYSQKAGWLERALDGAVKLNQEESETTPMPALTAPIIGVFFFFFFLFIFFGRGRC